MSKESRRLNLIFDRLAKGKTTTEINREFQQRAVIGQESKERGERTEMRVMDILSQEPIVKRVTRYRPGSKPDKKGIDLRAWINTEDFNLRIETVGIQVKSSQSGIIQFEKQIIGKYDIDENEVEEFLLLKKIVVLNGRGSREDIVNGFTEQVFKINALNVR